MATRSELAHHWSLDPDVVFLNHGSFGACPRTVLAYQQRLRDRLESQPVRFFGHELGPLLDDVRTDLARFFQADPNGLVFVRNATTGVNTALRALDLEPGDELLLTDQEYQACWNAAEYVAAQAGAQVVVAPLPFPLSSEDAVMEAVLGAVTPRTRFALLDYVTSQTGLVLPIARLVRELRSRGIETIVDGAHAPGMVPLALDELGAAFFTGNCHKWLCSPKGAAVFWVREDWRERTRPLVISHGASAPPMDRPRLHVEFDWMGTDDPTAVLSIGESLRFLEGLVDGGWSAIQRRNRELALESRRILCAALEVPPPAPDSMVGTLASVPLPPSRGKAPGPPAFLDELQVALMDRFRIEVPIVLWPRWPSRLVRTASQLYNHRGESAYLGEALRTLLR